MPERQARDDATTHARDEGSSGCAHFVTAGTIDQTRQTTFCRDDAARNITKPITLGQDFDRTTVSCLADGGWGGAFTWRRSRRQHEWCVGRVPREDGVTTCRRRCPCRSSVGWSVVTYGRGDARSITFSSTERCGCSLEQARAPRLDTNISTERDIRSAVLASSEDTLRGCEMVSVMLWCERG